MNIQVLTDTAGAMALCDEARVFLTIPADGSDSETEEEEIPQWEATDGTDKEQHRALEEARAEVATLKKEVEALKSQVSQGKARVKELWKINCDCLVMQEEELAAKDMEINQLKEQLRGGHMGTSPTSDGLVVDPVSEDTRSSSSREAEFRVQ